MHIWRSTPTNPDVTPKVAFSPIRMPRLIVEKSEPVSGPREESEKYMSFVDKAKNAAEDAVGKVKEAVGDATDNSNLEAEGKKDQGSAGVKKVGENIKDTFK
ncbi:hypothetical protein GOOTI_031_00240 [Gordonia otitidis NBRC 100426]|uniref:CsbD-like domain-containing protein n=2 Tax=Gordonia otitidis TaxID=249058 RepID=H5THB8_GORO1|nr:hypothetical protein GOOTI_031_00240 [Gordonia otitidis NBRC 100426]